MISLPDSNIFHMNSKIGKDGVGRGGEKEQSQLEGEQRLKIYINSFSIFFIKF